MITTFAPVFVSLWLAGSGGLPLEHVQLQGVPPLTQEESDAPLPTPRIAPPEAAPLPKGAPPAPKKGPPAVELDPKPRLPGREANPSPGTGPGAAPDTPTRQARPAPGAPRKGLTVEKPRTPEEQERALSDLYALLATAEDEKKAGSLTRSIERMWLRSGSDTVNLLMHRAMQAVQAKKPDVALKLLDAAVALAPDYPEAWNRRAYVHFLENNYDRSLGDLRRVLALDGNHYKALDGLMNILRSIDRKKEALAVARRLYDVNPFHEGVKAVVDQLKLEVEGRGI